MNTFIIRNIPDPTRELHYVLYIINETKTNSTHNPMKPNYPFRSSLTTEAGVSGSSASNAFISSSWAFKW